MPFGSVVKLKSGLMSITSIPVKETMIPAMFRIDIFSLIMNQAAKGVNTGIVAITTALIEAVECFSP